MQQRSFLVPAVAVSAVALVPACGGDDDGAGATTSAVTGTIPPSAPTPPP